MKVCPEVCRICLAANRRMFPFDSKNKQFYENVTGITTPPQDQLPKTICWECRNYLSKYFDFKSKAVTNQFILMEILKKQKITLKVLEKYQPKSSLICTTILSLNLDGIDHDESEDTTEDEAETKDIAEDETKTKDIAEDETKTINITEDETETMNHNDDMKFKNETDHIWEEQFDKINDDVDEICVKTEVDDKTIDYIKEEIINYKLSNDYKITIENVENLVETSFENIMNIESIEETDKSDDDDVVEITVDADKNIGSIKIIDSPPEDNAHNDESKSTLSSKSNDEVNSQNKSRFQLDKNLFNVTILSQEEMIADMQKRKENDDYVKAPLKCSDCFEGFFDAHLYNSHMKLHYQEIVPYSCDLCKQRFTKRAQVAFHMRSHYVRIACKQCDFTTHLFHLASKHELQHRGFLCKQCGATFVHRASYGYHVRVTHPTNILCRLCGRSFISELGLRMHNTIAHVDEDQSIPEDGPHCERCDLRFASQDAFDNHKRWAARHADERAGNKHMRPSRWKPQGGSPVVKKKMRTNAAGHSPSELPSTQSVHTDVCGPMPGPSWGGAKYLVTFTDDHTRKTYGYLMKEKSEKKKIEHDDSENANNHPRPWEIDDEENSDDFDADTDTTYVPPSTDVSSDESSTEGNLLNKRIQESSLTHLNSPCRELISVSNKFIKPVNIEQNMKNTSEELCTNTTKKPQPPKSKHVRGRDYCFYCENSVLNFARHLLRHHTYEIDVQEILSFPKKSVHRNNKITELRKKGNYIQNSVEVIKPMRKQKFAEYLPCPNCLGFYSKKLLWKHSKKCSGKQRKNVQSEAQNLLLRNLKVDEKLKRTVFHRMRADKVSLVAKSDVLICAFASQYLKTHRKNHFVNVVSRKMRELAKLLIEIKKNKPSVNNFFDALSPENYDEIVAATKIVGKFDTEKDRFDSPTFAMNISTSIKQCCHIAITMASKKQGPYREVNTAEIEAGLKTLIQLIDSQWKFDISSQASTDLNKKKWNKEAEINARKGKKRTLVPWTTEQKKIVTTFFRHHIKNKRPPKRNECENLKEKHKDLLINKDWLKIKVFVQNIYKKT